MACGRCSKKSKSPSPSGQTIFRQGTWDRDIWNSVYKNNEYGIKGSWKGSVIDVGAHTGAFVKFILERGAKKVWAIEPDPDNFNLLQNNMSKYVALDQVVLINKAIGPAGEEYGKLNDAGQNTGGIAYGPKEGGGILTMTLDDIVDEIPGPILLKIDCEGCEYFAIQQMQKLHRINSIVGEYHVRDYGSALSLQEHLTSNGFKFSHTVKTPNIGLFGAHQG